MTSNFNPSYPPGTSFLMDGNELNSMAFRQDRIAAFVTSWPCESFPNPHSTNRTLGQCGDGDDDNDDDVDSWVFSEVLLLFIEEDMNGRGLINLVNVALYDGGTGTDDGGVDSPRLLCCGVKAKQE